MKNKYFQSCVKSLTALAAGVVAACVLLPGTTLANCQNNNNANLASNGGFESGSGTNITSWKVEWPPRVDPFVYIDTSHPHSGAQDLALGSTSAANDIAQTIKSTTPGKIYTICFWLYSSPNATAGVTTLEVWWNNVDELGLTNSAQFGYQYFAVNVLAQGNDHLRFRERNKQGFYYLDDVAVQECTGCGLAAEGRSGTQK